MNQILNNIKTLYYIESRLLRNITIISGMGVMLNYWRDFHPMEIVGLARCEVSSRVENKVKIITQILTALLPEHFQDSPVPLSFLMETIDGSRFLIGLNETPFPVVNTADAFPDRTDDRSGCTLTVEYADTLGLMPILD